MGICPVNGRIAIVSHSLLARRLLYKGAGPIENCQFQRSITTLTLLPFVTAPAKPANLTHVSSICMRSRSMRRCTSTSTRSSCSGSWRSGWSPYTATTTRRASSVPPRTSITDTMNSTTGNRSVSLFYFPVLSSHRSIMFLCTRWRTLWLDLHQCPFLLSISET